MISIRDEGLAPSVSAVFARFGPIQQEMTKNVLDRIYPTRFYVCISTT